MLEYPNVSCSEGPVCMACCAHTDLNVLRHDVRRSVKYLPDCLDSGTLHVVYIIVYNKYYTSYIEICPFHRILLSCACTTFRFKISTIIRNFYVVIHATWSNSGNLIHPINHSISYKPVKRYFKQLWISQWYIDPVHHSFGSTSYTSKSSLKNLFSVKLCIRLHYILTLKSLALRVRTLPVKLGKKILLNFALQVRTIRMWRNRQNRIFSVRSYN